MRRNAINLCRTNESMPITKNQFATVQPLPEKIPAPIFQVGVSRVRWKPMPTAEWGTVMGMRYVWAEHLASWQWQYYIVLDPNSPSYQWAKSDWGWHDDLELLSDNSPFSTQSVEQVTADE